MALTEKQVKELRTEARMCSILGNGERFDEIVKLLHDEGYKVL